MGIRSMIAKSALKYASDAFGSFRGRGERSSDLAPVISRLDQLIEHQTPPWIAYATFAVSLLTFIVAVWILVRTY